METGEHMMKCVRGGICTTGEQGLCGDGGRREGLENSSACHDKAVDASKIKIDII